MRYVLALLLVGASGFATPDPYRFRIDVPPARQGQFGTATIAVVPADGYRLNAARRVELQLLSSGEGLVVDPEGRETRRLDEGGAEFAIRFKARTPGEKSFRASLRFEVCDAAECLPQAETVSFGVNVR
jgi:hypothetical protein